MTSHRPVRPLAAAALVASLLALAPVSGPGPLAAPPAGAATTELTFLGTLNHTMGTIALGAGPGEAFSSPAVGDVTGDSTPEIVVASLDGQVEAYRATDRSRIWSVDLGTTAIQASPTLADLGGDGKPDVVVATMDGRVVWLDGPTGRTVRTFRQGAPLHCPAGQDCRPDGFFASPAVADINGDRILDIVAPSYDHTVYAWSRTGGLLWRRYLEDTLWSSPVIADIDRDQKPEIILGGDIWPGNPFGVPQGGLVWVLKRDGSTYGGYPRSTPGQTVWSSPAVADLNGDKLPEIIVGTGANWPEPNGRRIDAFTARNRANLPGWPVSVDGRVVASPAVGDIDDDGALEVTVASDGGWVYAYEASGARKWRACNGLTTSSCKQGYSTKAGTSIGDVDGDGVQEVVSTLDKDIRVFDGRNGAVEDEYRMAHPATLAPGSTPSIAEAGGRTIIVQHSVYRSHGHGGGVLAGDVTKTYVLTTDHGLCRNDWPQFHRDARRTGTWRGGHDAWIPFDCPADFIRQQYEDFLGRAPDASGTTYWTSRLHNGTSGSSTIRSFIGSNEFGRVVSPVVRSYLAVHGTYPPTRQLIDDGVVAYRQGETAAELADGFAADPDVAGLTDEQFVTAVYRNVYKRDPSYLELAADVDRLEGGTTRGELASGYAEGSIGSGRLSTEVTVAMVYLGMLGRAPDPSGWSYWVPKARTSNTDVLVTGFQRSSEYARRVGT
ncbi:MAG: FG-GAP-like repeat-containing protein [Acidimicrobiales bacterium]